MNVQGALEDTDVMLNVPHGFDARIHLLISALFFWDNNKISTKLKLDDENLICHSTAGSGFKTVLGTEIFTAGGRYYF